VAFVRFAVGLGLDEAYISVADDSAATSSEQQKLDKKLWKWLLAGRRF
jgi:hypothetical protein